MEELFELFEEMGYGDLNFRQGSLSNREYPESFFTYWNISTPELRHRDDRSKEYGIDVMVYFYTNNARLIYSVIDEFVVKAKQKGFVIQSRPYDVPSDEDNFFGRAVSIRIIRKED